VIKLPHVEWVQVAGNCEQGLLRLPIGIGRVRELIWPRADKVVAGPDALNASGGRGGEGDLR
jgi:hypothetical protein